MTSFHPSFVAGFVKQCHALGLDQETTVAAFASFELQENMQDPAFARGFNKAAAGGSLLDALKGLGDGAKDMATKAKGAWDGASTATKGTIVGGVAGGAAGLMSNKNKIRNALLGAVLGGGAGHLVGRNAVPPMGPASEPAGKALQFSRGTDPTRINEMLTSRNLPSPVDTLFDRMKRRVAAGEELTQVGDAKLQHVWNHSYQDPATMEMIGVGRGIKEMTTPSPARDPFLWNLK
jgi:hypothetical protein